MFYTQTRSGNEIEGGREFSHLIHSKFHAYQTITDQRRCMWWIKSYVTAV